MQDGNIKLAVKTVRDYTQNEKLFALKSLPSDMIRKKA